MKAVLEKIEPVFGNSFTIRKFENSEQCNKPNWHFHPEYEIVFVSNGRGKRHIGDHVSYFEDGDLIFLGPNLPHFGFTDEIFEPHVEIVVQLKEDFLGQDFLASPELVKIKQLFERSAGGLTFLGQTKINIGERLLHLMELPHFNRLLELLDILHQLGQSEEFEVLNARGYALEVNPQDHDRMNRLYEFVQKNFQQQMRLEEVADHVNMTVPAFCRYFKKLTNKTFSHFANEYRIAHACRLLGNDDISITGVSYESGFNNLSHFNRQFKNITGLSPKGYRKNLKKVVAL